ncbi:hypothetical protein [Rhizobium mongolense]|uniref:Uncharacterized protein n=2 Tax=Rhizobium mongolense TaxID=57676 RepID=A0ABR6IL30_9HYPH|nr:hypothetical protein [Rhizobium mongolense]MBB4228505.1 hypothetical protein [Rhizobium mongolense]TVZ64359.1 hypothetical protein BCL32_4600 [Rhizobium mongolense USDA 1844]
MIIYATKHDADVIRKWINDEPDIAWIVKVAEQDQTCHWKAISAIEALEEQTYALWHTRSGPLNIPSCDRNVPDAIVADPFAGWSQTMQHSGATSPWFGGNLPGPYSFTFAESGREAPGSLARSGFYWLEDRYKSVGKPANPEAKLWWKKLRRFLEKSTTQVPWANVTNRKRTIIAYVFPEAKIQIDQGRHRDLNP